MCKQTTFLIHTPALLPLLPFPRALQAQQPGRFFAMTSLVILGSLAGHGQTFAGKSRDAEDHFGWNNFSDGEG